MYKILTYIMVFSICILAYAQSAETQKDTAWDEVNRLARKYWEIDSPTKDNAKSLIETLNKYIEGKNLDTDRQKLALNLLIGIYKKHNMNKEMIDLTNKFISENNALSNIQQFLRLEKQNAYLNQKDYKNALKLADEHLKMLSNADKTDELRIFKAKTLVIKAKSLIMLNKENSEAILKELDTIISNFSNKSNVLAVRSEKTALKRFIKLHPGAKLDDWTATDFDNETVNFSDFNGKKVVLFFWKSWEGKCTYFFEKKIEKFLKKLGEQSIEFLAISSESVETQKQFLEKNTFACKFLHDPQSKVIRDYSIESLPYFVYVDENAKVISTGDLNFFDSLNDSIKKKEEK